MNISKDVSILDYGIGNLLSVCKKCHNKFTKNDKKHIKIDTTKGPELMEI